MSINGIPQPDLERLGRAWTGHRAYKLYVPTFPCDRPEVPWSELAVHTGHAGKPVCAFASFRDNERSAITWVQVLVPNGDGFAVLDGLPHEVLPCDVANRVEADDEGALSEFAISPGCTASSVSVT